MAELSGPIVVHNTFVLSLSLLDSRWKLTPAS